MSEFDAKEVKDKVVNWIRNWFNENGNDCCAVVGISGGKDSSIVAALCVEALGKDRVFGVLMPNGEQVDIDASYKLVNHLGIEYCTINIHSAIRVLKHEIKPQLGDHWSVQTSVNLPARIRMATLYGDGAGDFSPLSKLTVTEVKALGRELNLPAELVDKVPTDGLCGHTDEDNLGFTYDVLDRYIRTGEIDDKRTKERIDSMHEKNLFKLQLMPSFEYAVNPQTEVLNNKQTGYDVVSKYIKKYWECHCTEDVIVSIEISRDGKNYERINEVASPYNMYDVEFLNDWWEGERYVRVNGIQGISGIKCKNI